MSAALASVTRRLSHSLSTAFSLSNWIYTRTHARGRGREEGCDNYSESPENKISDGTYVCSAQNGGKGFRMKFYDHVHLFVSTYVFVKLRVKSCLLLGLNSNQFDLSVHVKLHQDTHSFLLFLDLLSHPYLLYLCWTHALPTIRYHSMSTESTLRYVRVLSESVTTDMIAQLCVVVIFLLCLLLLLESSLLFGLCALARASTVNFIEHCAMVTASIPYGQKNSW